MSFEVNTELLSAYIDEQLPEPERRRLEEHLARSPKARERLESLRRIVEDLRRIEREAPPLGLEHMVARRIALEGDRTSMLDRLEQGMGTLARQSPIFLTFAVVIALMLMIFLFSYALEQHSSSGGFEVIFSDPPPEAIESVQLILAERTFVRQGGLWVEAGLLAADAEREVALDSPEGRELIAAHPELETLEGRDEIFILELGDEVLRLHE